MSIRGKIKLFLGTGFLLGLSPVVPGSFGAIPGLFWHGLVWTFGFSSMSVRLWCLLGALLFSAIHYWLTPWAQAHWKCADPKHFVLDEIVGYLFVPVFTYVQGPCCPFWILPVGFCLFRIFDAIKLPGARYIDRNIHSAHGVLFDDIVSAAYTGVVLSCIAFFI